jgi:hypothetical protein
LAWPSTFPTGWLVEWDPSLATITLPSDAMYKLHRGIQIDAR